MSAHSFKAVLVRPEGIGTWTFVPVPEKVSRAFTTRGRVPVTGTIQDVPFTGAMMPDGNGGHFIVVKAEIREKAGVTAGDAVTVTIRKDEKTRTVEVPPELASVLREDTAARKAFDAMSYSHQKEYAQWIAEAKKPETRAARAQKALGMIIEGQRLKG